MSDERKPFYGPVNRRALLFVGVELLETTKPDSMYPTYTPTGRRRAYLYGIRIPMRVWRLIASLTRK